jgi:hypothetical protein
LPQLPQLRASDDVFTHAPSHFAKPLLHVKSHVPEMHVAEPFAGASQIFPHSLQLTGSLATSAHDAPHFVRFASQVKSHALPLQIGWPPAGAPQPMLQPPQCVTELVTSTHDDPHCVRFPGQVAAQAPTPHTSGEAQALVQLPQCAASICVSTQTPSQFWKPVSQVTPHTPPAQLGEPLATSLHWLPHLEQLFGSVCKSTQTGPQRVSAPHTKSHVPPTQTAVPPLGAVQPRPQPLQLSTSDLVSTHAPAQTISPVRHSAGASVPASPPPLPPPSVPAPPPVASLAASAASTAPPPVPALPPTPPLPLIPSSSPASNTEPSLTHTFRSASHTYPETHSPCGPQALPSKSPSRSL